MIVGKKTSGAEKLFRQKDAGAAMTEYEQAKQAEAAKTVRLRALRLAKEAEDRLTADKAKEEEARLKAEKAAARKRRK